MSGKDLSNKSKQYLEKKIRDTNASIDFLKGIHENTKTLEEDLNIYKAVLASKTTKIRKKLDDKTKRLIEISRSIDGLEYDENDNEKVRNSKIKHLEKRQNELQRIDREVLRPLADEESDPESSEHWAEMEINYEKWHEFEEIKRQIEKQDKRSKKIKTLRDMGAPYGVASSVLIDSDGNLDKAIDTIFNLRSSSKTKKSAKKHKKKGGPTKKKGGPTKKKGGPTKKKGGPTKKKKKKQKGGKYKTKKKSKSKR